MALFTAYVRTLGKSAGAQNEFCGPMAKQQRMFIVTLVAAYLGAAPAAWRPNWWGIPAFALLIVSAGCVVTSLRRLGRIARTLRAGTQAHAGGGAHGA
jgi:hypothetical protein